MASQGVFQKEAGLFHADQGEGAAGLDLHGDVHIAIGAIVAAGNGAKHCQVTHTAAAEFRFLLGESLSDTVKGFGHHGGPEIQVLRKDRLARTRVPEGG
jgi:hypothetical protein